ncbi:hypothetical protein DM02DRAFT_715739 [Periconia macrospinosa]|uniref:NmrA-like domain-containing protein n=1 Tax=Periconia macrospinosa TaxID=97972 RepID=A0A2V1E505_9PLEO|nr:hypothetical protein DM02DRAFT_715739 [Periconia macrospinosa]
MSHADNYGLTPPYTTIALFGANGQIGDYILEALVHPPRHQFNIIGFIPPSTQLQSNKNAKNVTVKEFDLITVSPLEAQPTIQDAAADAGVKRFYPSEYGMHHIYRKPGDSKGYVHPAWNLKADINEQALLHPSVRNGSMSFTLIGCGDFYNQAREKTWCPWAQPPSSAPYQIHVIGSPSAQADFTHLADFTAFLVATLLEPQKSHNQFLNVVSDTISHEEIKALLEKYSGKEVVLDVRDLSEMHKVIDTEGECIKEEELKDSAFPVDFWFLVKGLQGSGRFVRHPSQIHNGRFPEVRRTSFEKYFKERFGEVGAKL